MRRTLRSRRFLGFSGQALRFWGLLLLGMGVAGQSLIQNGALHMGSVSLAELTETLESSEVLMSLAATSLIMQAVQSCAIPVFVFLLVEGFHQTGDFQKYLLRMFALALLCELPYNLAVSGRIWAPESRNPVFAMAFALVLLFFLKSYSGRGGKSIVSQAAVILASLLWVFLLKVVDGGTILLLTAAFWLFWEKPVGRLLAGAAVLLLCGAMNLPNIIAPLGLLLVHFYNGEQGGGKRILNYLYYPLMLLVFAGIAWLMSR